jgi:hypothetical protein
LEALKKKERKFQSNRLKSTQREDMDVFIGMVEEHQDEFGRTWDAKIREQKQREDDMINALKWKHDQQQQELYEKLQRKLRVPKFSQELLNLRKRQVLMARTKRYVEAEKLRQNAEQLEKIEIENIRREAKRQNQIRFQTLLTRQHWERVALQEKLNVEKKCLMEAKAQDYLRLRKRFRNAEAELRKTHIRQRLHATKKLTPVYSTLQRNIQLALTDNSGGGGGGGGGGDDGYSEGGRSGRTSSGSQYQPSPPSGKRKQQSNKQAQSVRSLSQRR